MNQEIFIDVKVQDVIDALTNHRSAHIAEFEEAYQEYWTQLEEEMTYRWNDLLEGIQDRSAESASIFSELKKPINKTQDYDNQINMFEHTLRAGKEVIELSQQQFNQIVNDQFDWAISAKFLNSSYTVASQT